MEYDLFKLGREIANPKSKYMGGSCIAVSLYINTSLFVKIMKYSYNDSYRFELTFASEMANQFFDLIELDANYFATYLENLKQNKKEKIDIEHCNDISISMYAISLLLIKYSLKVIKTINYKFVCEMIYLVSSFYSCAIGSRANILEDQTIDLNKIVIDHQLHLNQTLKIISYFQNELATKLVLAQEDIEKIRDKIIELAKEIVE